MRRWNPLTTGLLIRRKYSTHSQKRDETWTSYIFFFWFLPSSIRKRGVTQVNHIRDAGPPLSELVAADMGSDLGCVTPAVRNIMIQIIKIGVFHEMYMESIDAWRSLILSFLHSLSSCRSNTKSSPGCKCLDKGDKIYQGATHNLCQKKWIAITHDLVLPNNKHSGITWDFVIV